jgi:uncharacterized membrane protein YphA (DoxX/SURF4 family)
VTHQSRRKRLELIHQERLAAMEKGIPLPEFPLELARQPHVPDPNVIPILGTVLLSLSAGRGVRGWSPADEVSLPFFVWLLAWGWPLMVAKSYSAGSEVMESKARGPSWRPIGFRPGNRFAVLAGLGEFLGGLLLAWGRRPGVDGRSDADCDFDRPQRKRLFRAKQRTGTPVLYITGALVVAVVGPGPYSLDQVFGMDSIFSDTFTWIVLACGVLGAFSNLAMRDKPELPAESSLRDSAAAR